MRLSLVRFALCAVPVFAIALGCGSSVKTIEVKGKIVLPSSVKLTETDDVRVDFLPEAAATANSGGTASATGPDLNFTIKAPPGKYKVSVNVKGYPGEKNSEKREREINNVIGTFQSGSSSLRYEVTADENQTITIDLAKGAISK